LKSGSIQKKIESLLKQLQDKTGVSDEELEELKRILKITDYSNLEDL
tara:strand:- start:154 stop:294 length:141 start_codon:yes stop_codon:yes gene_type:complete